MEIHERSVAGGYLSALGIGGIPCGGTFQLGGAFVVLPKSFVLQRAILAVPCGAALRDALEIFGLKLFLAVFVPPNHGALVFADDDGFLALFLGAILIPKFEHGAVKRSRGGELGLKQFALQSGKFIRVGGCFDLFGKFFQQRIICALVNEFTPHLGISH